MIFVQAVAEQAWEHSEIVNLNTMMAQHILQFTFQLTLQLISFDNVAK